MADFTFKDKLFGLIRFNRQNVIGLELDTTTNEYVITAENYEDDVTDKLSVTDQIDGYKDKTVTLETTTTDKVKVTITVKDENGDTKTGNYTITLS